MDELEEKDVSVSVGSVIESTVVISEHVAGKGEISVESMAASEGQDQAKIEGSLDEGVAVEASGRRPCNGEDIKVEPSDSCVVADDGVCAQGMDDGHVLVEAGSEREEKNLGSGVVDDFGSQGARVSCGEASNLGSETAIEQDQVVVEEVRGESLEGNLVDVSGEVNNVGGGGDVVDQTSSKEAVVVGNEAKDGEKAVVDGGETQVLVEEVQVVDGGETQVLVEEVQVVDGGETQVLMEDVQVTDGGETQVIVEEVQMIGGETQVLVEEAQVVDGGETLVLVEEVQVVAREENLDGDEGMVGSEVDATKDNHSLEVAGKVQDGGVESGSVGSPVAEGSSGEETQVVEQVAGKIESEHGLQKELVEVSDAGRERVDGRDNAYQDMGTQEMGDMNNEVWNPGIETEVTPSSAMVDHSRLQDQAIEEEAAAMCKVEGMEIDAFDDNLCFSVEELHGKPDALDESTENDSNVFADTICTGQLTQRVVGGEVAMLDERGYPDSAKEQQLMLEGSGHSVAPDFGKVDSNVEPKAEVDRPAAAVVEQADLHVEKDIQGEQQGEDVETANTSTECCPNVHADSTGSCQSTQAVIGDETAGMDYKVLSHPSFEISDYVDLDGMLSYSGNDQILTAETVIRQTETDAQVIDRGEENASINNEKVLTSNTEAMEPVQIDQQLKPEGCLDKSAACDIDQVDSNIAQPMEVEGGVTDTEQVGLPGGEEKEAEAHTGKVEIVAGCTANCDYVFSDSTVLSQSSHASVGGEFADVQDKASLNPSVEASQCANMDGMLLVSGTDQHLNSEMVYEGTVRDSHVMDRSEIASMGNEEALNSNPEDPNPNEQDQLRDPSEVDSNIGQDMQIDVQLFDAEVVSLHGGQETEIEQQDTDSEQPITSEEKSIKQAVAKPGSSVKPHQATYQLPQEDEGEFSVSDLVWGKVRSHPWWPGQIFDPSDASDKAIKYLKKDCYLVAYFGDRTFAWNEASLLKPFRMHFSQVEKQGNSESFQNAVDCALEEVSRRVELGLACSCTPKDDQDKIKFQIVENTGIRQESSMRDGVDPSANPNFFEPDKLINYVKSLAQIPSGGADRLELVIAKAQLLAFYRLKGYCQLPEFQFCGGLLENDVDTTNSDGKIRLDDGSDGKILVTQRGSYHKRKHNLKDSLYPRKKERSLCELMGGSWDSFDDEFGSDGKATGKVLSPSSGRKRKGMDSFADEMAQEGRKTISLAKVSITTPPFSKPSFKIGDCIRRVASQMTGSPSILKFNSEKSQKLDGSSDGLAGDEPDDSLQNSEDAQRKKMIVPTEYSSLDDLLSQLHIAAQGPLNGYSFLNIVISFFSDFRDSVIVDHYSAMDKVGGKRKKASHSIAGSPETFEFEDMSDTYWTDRVIQNGSEEQASRKNRKKENQLVPIDPPVQPSRRSYSRKRYSDGSHDLAAQKPPGYVDERAPAELVMNFAELDTIPSESNLNKMFRHFGPLKESETEVDVEASRARVVFKRCSDAEVAFNSAGKFNIFGPMHVNYQLNYSISDPFKTQPIATAQVEDDAMLFLQY